MTAPAVAGRMRRAATEIRRRAQRRAGRRAGRRGAVGVWLAPALLVVVLVVAWQVWVSLGRVAAYVLPSPVQIVDAFLQTRGILVEHVLVTTEEALLGLASGAVVGVALAVVIASIRLARQVVYPLLVGSQTIPMVVLAPLLVLWFGYGMTPKVVVVALIVFFPVAVSTVAGLAGADRELVDLVRSMGAGRLQVLRTVLAPAAVPAFFSGLKISSAYAVAGAVIGEWVGASQGLGIFIDRSRASYEVDRIFVAVAIIAALSMALFGLVELGNRLAAPWQHVAERTARRP